MLDAIRGFAETTPEAVQWLAVIAVSAIPFVESYFGSVIGVVIGLPPVVAIGAAVVGNFISMAVLVLGAAKVRGAVRGGRTETTPKRARLKRMFDRFGVPGVSLLGQTVLPSQITSMAMVSFGASRDQVLIWQTISIVLWGIVFGTLATFGINLLGMR
ncbi:hypothetical protein [Naumannella cuiyingiana]|uniref:Putative membrane protein n=1 Tax=Naumannella cuiyingiana TaxID=1347891 RepID=A0A7Z0IKU5_9ACTN|nr:hypothetical protein [Naumannella cuiyingiana]NYI70896.1 putative membrane protein [Naumannella cuiyingiana]